MRALAEGRTDAPSLTAAERELLAYAKKITEAAYKTTPEDVQRLRDYGWTEEQISEAVYIIALFAFFNRVAEAFGIPEMGYLQSPPPGS